MTEKATSFVASIVGKERREQRREKEECFGASCSEFIKKRGLLFNRENICTYVLRAKKAIPSYSRVCTVKLT